MVTKTRVMLTVAEVAERFHVSKQSVVRAIRAGALKAQKFGWQWAIDERDLPKEWDKAGASKD